MSFRTKLIREETVRLLGTIALLLSITTFTFGQQAPVAPCSKNISFATVFGSQIATGTPDFVAKWSAKNAKKFPGMCFSQEPVAGARNYLVVFATSQSAYVGLYPSVRTNTTINTTPVSGSGTVTDIYGGTWFYNYTGTLTTTTTTTTETNLPYSDTYSTLFAYTYDQSGALLSRHSRTRTARQGGDPYNTLGYNMGSMLGSIHIRQRLVNDVVKEVAKGW